jgi:hypothetical protein
MIAYLMPIYDSEDKTFHPFAKKMIDEFCDNIDFLNQMGAKMGSFGWVGSPIGYYENEINMYKRLHEHPNPIVKDFARRQIEVVKKHIYGQKIDEEERYLGQ